jgi:hypothetical protein
MARFAQLRRVLQFVLIIGLSVLAAPVAGMERYPQPVIFGVSPESGPPGTAVTITGTGFAGLDAAWFGTAKDAVPQQLGRTEIRVVVPQDAPLGADALVLLNPLHRAVARKPFTVTAATAGFALRVAGNHLVDGAGRIVQLRGANISGLESTAIQGWAPDNPWGDAGLGDEPQWSTLKSWQINAVRLPLNEASWLGLTTYDENGSPRQADPGGNYQAVVIKSVADATAAGLYVILDLHWSGPNVMVPGQAAPVPQTPFEGDGGQNPMADMDHSIAFWTSIARTFQANPAVVFELYNEPYFYWLTAQEDEWDVLLNGGTITQYVTGGDPDQVTYDWQAAGMQPLLDAVRATGAANVVLTGGVDWCGDMQSWLSHMPADPLHQLGASWHAYPLSDTVGDPNAIVPTDGTAQYGYVQAIAATVPVVITETGDHDASGTVGSPFDSIVLPWADTNGVSYLGWTWDPWGSADFDLILDASGTPTDGYGQYFHDHLACVASGGTNCP